MRRDLALLFATLTLSGCASTAAPSSVPSEATRLAADSVLPSCTLPVGCAPLDLDPAFCTEDPRPFQPSFMRGRVVSVGVIPGVAESLGFEPGRWWAAWPDPRDACQPLVVSFLVGAQP